MKTRSTYPSPDSSASQPGPDPDDLDTDVWLAAAILFGFGGPAIAVLLMNSDSEWCSAPFVGCLGAAFVFASCGWLLGACASMPSLKIQGGWRVAAFGVAIWNLLGLGASVVIGLLVAIQ